MAAALAQKFPHLKHHLPDALEYARQFYGDAVLSYNTAIQKVPGSIVARVFKFASREYFEAEDAARVTPQVKF